MPEKSRKSGPNYRWTGNDIIYPVGWSNISGSFSVWDLTNGTGVMLMNAVTLQVAAAICTVAALHL